MNRQSSDLITQQVISNERISNDSAILKFRKNFNFRAGQVIGITTDEALPPRMYSIASGEHSDIVEILYMIVTNGILTKKLWKLKPGDEILINGPYGKFTSDSSPSWYISNGTGIAPFLSMILSGYGSNKIVIHGSRSPDNFYNHELLEQHLKERYIRCYTGNGDNTYFKGRVTDFLTQSDKLPVDNKYYLCGSAEMVVDARQILIDRGIPFQNILSEIYF